MGDQNHVFQHLCKSAFDFLNRAAAEIEREPKYALVHFSVGLELILKARLLREHWSLVVTSRPDLKKFRTGDFTSVSLEDAAGRIVAVLGEGLTRDAKLTFERIVQHRNRVVHFVHDLEKTAQETLRQAVATDLCLGWLHLRELLDTWSTHFDGFKKEIDGTAWQMRRVRSFLQVVYDRKKRDLAKQKNCGVEIRSCPSCGFEAAPVRMLTDNLLSQQCEVCRMEIPLLRFECSSGECGIIHTVSGWHHFQQVQCECGDLNTQNDLRDTMDTSSTRGGEASEVINCAECTGHDTVVEHYGYYVGSVRPSC